MHEKDKTFNCNMDPEKFVYETQAIQENSIDRDDLQTTLTGCFGKFKRIRAQGECLGIRSR